MKKMILLLKYNLCLALLLVSGLVYSQGFPVTCLNQNQVNFTVNGTTNAVGFTLTNPTSNGVDTYKTWQVVIPFYQNSLTGTLKIRTNTYCDYSFQPDGYGRLEVNGIAYVGGVLLGNEYIIPASLSVGSHFYTVKSYCGTTLCNTQLLAVQVVKEAAPSLNLTITPYCKLKPHVTPEQYSGYIGFKANGSYTNALNLYLDVTNTAGVCTPSPLYTKLTYLSTDANLPNNTVSNSGFYDCNASTTYTVRMMYRKTSINGNLISYTFPNGAYGWNDLTWTKSFKTCMNILPADPIKFPKRMALLYPNPVKGELNINLPEGVELHAVKVYDDNRNLMNQKEFLRNDNATLDLNTLQRGVYYVEIQTSEGLKVERIVKE